MVKFRSKVDWWVALILGLIFILLLGTIVICLIAHKYILTGIVAALTAYFAWQVSTLYVISGDMFIITGPTGTKIPIHSIRTIQKTRNPLSSPALSLDRLEITHDRGQVLISPRNQQEFIESLKQVNPNIIVR